MRNALQDALHSFILSAQTESLEALNLSGNEIITAHVLSSSLLLWNHMFAYSFEAKHIGHGMRTKYDVQASWNVHDVDCTDLKTGAGGS